MNGILFKGDHFEIPDVAIISPGPGAPVWDRLDRGDYAMRSTRWIRQIILHTTKGIWPQVIRPGAGRGGRGQSVAEFWQDSDDHSAAQFVIDDDGTLVQLCDVATVAAYHATTSNDWSAGFEIYQDSQGGIYEAQLRTLARALPVMCALLRMPFQIHSGPYRNTIVERMKNGGENCVGIFGHRDQAWKFPWQLDAAGRRKYPGGYANRGRGDPGDEAYKTAIAAGAEAFDFNKLEDLTAWKRRQAKMNVMGAKLGVDGICGPGTMSAMATLGFTHGAAIDA